MVRCEPCGNDPERQTTAGNWIHSFSHVPFGYPGMTRDRAIAEYRHCAEVALELGIPTTCFVFSAEFGCVSFGLARCGIRLLSRCDELPIRSADRRIRSLYMVFADFVGLSPSIVEPLSRKAGFYPGSLLIRCEDGWRKYIPDASRLRRLRKDWISFVEKAAFSRLVPPGKSLRGVATARKCCCPFSGGTGSFL